MSDFNTYVFFPASPIFTYCILSGYLYLCHLFFPLPLFPQTINSILREPWQFYIQLCLFIIVPGTFWKFNNLCSVKCLLYFSLSYRLVGAVNLFSWPLLTSRCLSVLWNWYLNIILKLISCFTYIGLDGSCSSLIKSNLILLSLMIKSNGKTII